MGKERRKRYDMDLYFTRNITWNNWAFNLGGYSEDMADFGLCFSGLLFMFNTTINIKEQP